MISGFFLLWKIIIIGKIKIKAVMKKYKKLTVQQALSKAAYLCLKNPRCRFDIEKKLSSWQLDIAQIENVIDYLIANDYINDQRYVNSYVHDKVYFSRWGFNKINYKLKQKKIATELIDKAQKRIPPDDYLQVLFELLEKKLLKIKYQNNFQAKQKLINFAQARGYNWQDIMTQVKKINFDNS